MGIIRNLNKNFEKRIEKDFKILFTKERFLFWEYEQKTFMFSKETIKKLLHVYYMGGANDSLNIALGKK